MKPINIYTLTRIKDPDRLSRLERQLSRRGHHLKVKEWETDGLRAFIDNLTKVSPEASGYEFFYSFTMPKLGKEFDLIRVGSGSVVNIELKSGNVSDEVIRDQLLANKYYISTLGLNMHFYTYISNQDRLVRLSNSEKLVETDAEELAVVLNAQRDCYTGHIEELFSEDRYLISPLTDPGRFLREEYFLTSQQKDIKNQILKKIRWGNEAGIPVIQGFTGLPGTGKTILLYDLAMSLSRWDKVCVLHFGSHLSELEQLDERLKRIDFYYCTTGEKFDIEEDYTAILVDEGHRIDKANLEAILELSAKWRAPVIFSYDREDAIAEGERAGFGAELIEALDGFSGHRLTNRIRLNSELSTFINCVMGFKGKIHRRDFASVSLAYAGDDIESGQLILNYQKDGYMYIKDDALSMPVFPGGSGTEGHSGAAAAAVTMSAIDISDATCREFDKVVMLIDESFFYDEGGFLRCGYTRDALDAVNIGEDTDDTDTASESHVRALFHGLSRAKKNIAVVVKNNMSVFDVLLYILQR